MKINKSDTSTVQTRINNRSNTSSTDIIDLQVIQTITTDACNHNGATCLHKITNRGRESVCTYT
jgi:ankyrin repeat protein